MCHGMKYLRTKLITSLYSSLGSFNFLLVKKMFIIIFVIPNCTVNINGVRPLDLNVLFSMSLSTTDSWHLLFGDEVLIRRTPTYALCSKQFLVSVSLITSLHFSRIPSQSKYLFYVCTSKLVSSVFLAVTSALLIGGDCEPDFHIGCLIKGTNPVHFLNRANFVLASPKHLFRANKSPRSWRALRVSGVNPSA